MGCSSVQAGSVPASTTTTNSFAANRQVVKKPPKKFQLIGGRSRPREPVGEGKGAGTDAVFVADVRATARSAQPAMSDIDVHMQRLLTNEVGIVARFGQRRGRVVRRRNVQR